jgi:predicted helicase
VQAIAISIFVKKPGLERSVWHGDLWGGRLEKYKKLADGSMKNVDLAPINTVAPYFLFARQGSDLIRKEYEASWRLTEIYPTNVLGFQSHRDDFAFSFDLDDLKVRTRQFLSSRDEDEQIANRFFPASHTENSEARSRRIQMMSALRTRMAELTNIESYLTKASYFPFDERWCIYNKAVVDRPRRELIQHVYNRNNICLNVVRQTKQQEWRHALVSALPTTPLYIETKDGSYVFPIFLYPRHANDTTSDNRSENLSAKFRNFIDERYEHHYTPEEIASYIYAVLHAPVYRTRYSEFLRIDFPRVRFPESADDFETLSTLGWALVQAHLLRELPRRGLAAYNGKGDHTVEAVRYSSTNQAITINETQFFKPVPQAVWEFQIGGYQVLDKYLKSRKGRALSLDEINHVGAVADSLAFTIEQMANIDKAYRAAFPDQG